ncbi:ATP-binding protein [Streptomyces sp. NBC_00322]|uniref:ATP-binding protein n=1 Tax=Streptomyces sp. NBC_00322 TaxID=2975712 RepID=UPI002E2C20F2|nr:ATP-binding protein [Streptomyces sp. NBC_00322]
MSPPDQSRPGGMQGSSDLLGSRLAVVEDRLRLLYAQRTADDHGDEPGEGSDEHQKNPAAGADSWDIRRYGDEDPLVRLSQDFNLSPVDIDLLACALLPELITVCGAAYRMMSGAHSARPTVALALDVLGIPLAEGLARGLLRATSPLLADGLMEYENPDATWPERLLRVPDRVLTHLLGNRDSAVAETCAPHLQVVSAGAGPADPPALAELRPCLADDANDAAQPRTVYLQEGTTGLALSAACAALREVGQMPLVVNPEDLEHAPDDFTDAVVREARLLRGAVIVPVFVEPDGREATVLRRLITGLARAPLTTVLYGNGTWDTEAWGVTPAAFLDLTRISPKPTTEQAPRPPAGERLCMTAAAALDRARRRAAVRARVLPPEEALQISHDCALRDLGRLARHVRPSVTWDDLVLPPLVRERLEALTFRIRHRARVLGEWHLRRGGGRGWGATALFAGDSGTGKTMAAEVVAAELAVDLYIVSLPAVVSKYIGETEKNLEKIFSAAESLSGVIVFDEADSMFAKRGAVRDANDRYANMQSAYLLQRLESFDGLAVLTTNLRSNLDSAFTRRFDEVIEFQSPGTDVRARLWRKFLGRERADTCGIDHLAARFNLAGGSIRAVVETAAFAAAAQDRDLSMKDLLQGVEVEYRKLGRLFNDP